MTRTVCLFLVALLLAGCGAPLTLATPTALPPTPLPPTVTPAPTLPPTSAPTVAPTSASEALSLSGHLAFTSDRDGSAEIYDLDLASGAVTRLTDNEAYDWSPAWSPDGGTLAFASDREGRWDIYLLPAGGGDPVRLTDHEKHDWGAAWSPAPEGDTDGQSIAFASERDGKAEVYVMAADGSGQTNLTNNPAADWAPAWSPALLEGGTNGQAIVFVSTRDGQADLYWMRPDGSGVTRLTTSAADDWRPAWSPDGQSLAFMSMRDGNWEIYVMPAPGPNGESHESQAKRLTSDPANDYDPSWVSAPGGPYLAFSSDRGGDFDIYVMRADGSGVTNVTDNPAQDGNPTWGP